MSYEVLIVYFYHFTDELNAIIFVHKIGLRNIKMSGKIHPHN